MIALLLLTFLADDRHGDPLPPGALARLGTVRLRTGTGDFGCELVFTPDGKRLIGGGHGAVRTWNAATGRLVRELPLGTFYVSGIALSPDGKLAALGGKTYEKDGKGEVQGFRVVDVATGATVRHLPRTGFRYGRRAAFSPDGKYLASVVDQSVRIEEVRSGAVVIAERFGRDIALVGFFGATVAAVEKDELLLWEWQAGSPPRRVPLPPRRNGLSFTADGTRVVAGSDDDGRVQMWDAVAGRPVWVREPVKGIHSARAFLSPDGRRVAVTTFGQRAVILLDATTGAEQRRVPVTSRHAPTGVTWSPNSRRLAVCDLGSVRIYDAATGRETATPDGHRAAPSSLGLLADGTAMTASDDGTVRLWDATTGAPRRTIVVDEHWVRGAALSPDGRYVAASHQGDRPAVTLWDAATGRLVYRLPGHGQLGGYRVIAFTADGTRFQSWGDDRSLRAWRVLNGKATAEHLLVPDGEPPPDADADEDPPSYGTCVFSRDGTRFAMSRHGDAIVFDTATGRQVRKLTEMVGRPYGASFSPDGRRFAVSAPGKARAVKLPDGGWRQSSEPGGITVFDVTTGTVVRTIPQAGNDHGPIAFSPDGATIVATSRDGANQLTFHDAATGAVRGSISQVPASVRAMTYSPDGKRVLVGLQDTTAVIYPVPTK